MTRSCSAKQIGTLAGQHEKAEGLGRLGGVPSEFPAVIREMRNEGSFGAKTRGIETKTSRMRTIQRVSDDGLRSP
jgi:hypothetical protein